VFFLLDWVKRRVAAREPFVDAWRAILERRVPFYRRFDAAERGRFEDKLKVFVRTKHFEGVKGMVIDDEVKIVIAAAAARLVMNLPDEHYTRLSDIVVYPSHFKPKDAPVGTALGLAFGAGTVVLSWDAVLSGLADPHDGHDTATHELAHALDAADGAFDGTPELATFDAYGPWTRVMTDSFDSLRRAHRKNRRPLLREYGATNEAEFFAVATEVFFEKPVEMRERQPSLYEVLSLYYRADPARDRKKAVKPSAVP
jgi:Mlc titration factor MtfA (ptsG expression regulator)